LQIVDLVGSVLIVSLQKFLNIGQEVREVCSFLLFFLTLVDTFSLCDIFHLSHFLLFLKTVPLDDLSNSANGRKIEVIDICVMGNANERLMDVGIGETLDLSLQAIGLFQIFIQDLDIVIEKNGRYHCQGNIGLDVLVGLIVAVHADIGQEVDVTQQIVELVGESLEKFRQSARVVSSEGHLDHFVSIFIEEIIRVFISLGNAVFHFELKVIVISLAHEEIHQNLLLVFLENDIISSNESRKKTQMLGCQITLTIFCRLCEEIIDEIFDDAVGDHGANRYRVVLQDVDQTFLDERLVDVVRLHQEEPDPPGKVDFVLEEVLDYLLHQDIRKLENLGNFKSDCPVLSDIVVAENLLEGLIEREDKFDNQLSNTSLHQNLLNLTNRTIARRLNITVISSIDLSNEQFQDGDERHKQILIEFQEHIFPGDVRIRLFVLQLSGNSFNYLHEGLLRG